MCLRRIDCAGSYYGGCKRSGCAGCVRTGLILTAGICAAVGIVHVLGPLPAVGIVCVFRPLSTVGVVYVLGPLSAVGVVHVLRADCLVVIRKILHFFQCERDFYRLHFRPDSDSGGFNRK